jgi:hypothetical protein
MICRCHVLELCSQPALPLRAAFPTSSCPTITFRLATPIEAHCEVIFASCGHLNAIHGFDRCTSLCRILIPASVEIIGWSGFFDCTSLSEVIFSSDSHLREINGFKKCNSLYRISIPASVEIIRGFDQCHSQQEALFSSDSRIRVITEFTDERDLKKDFLTYRDDIHLTHSRLRLQLSNAATR